MGSMNKCLCSGVEDLQLLLVPLGATVSGLELTCSGAYDLGLTFSWTAGSLTGAEPPGQRHLRWG